MLKRILIASAFVTSVASAAPHKITFDSGGVCEVDGQKMFPLSVAVLPPPDAKAPSGQSAWQELRDGGVNLVRVVPKTQAENYGWTPKGYQLAHEYFDVLGKSHLFVWLWTGEELGYFTGKDTVKQAKLKKLIETFKDEPALFGWKGEDEP